MRRSAETGPEKLNVSRVRCREPRRLTLVRRQGGRRMRLASVSGQIDRLSSNVKSFALVGL
jgi:hypothetical protein